MAAARPILGLISFILLAGGILLQFLVILSGAVNGSPENKIYFLQADTSAIQPTPRNPSRWTFFAICGVDANGLNTNCGNVVPALPFDPVRNFGTTNGVPASFIGTNKFYYLSRFMFAFYLVALFFAAISLLTGLLALCSRLGGYISGLNTAIALFFQLLAAALMTSWVVIGRNNFRSAGLAANIGTYAMGFTWASAACFMICTVLYCVGGSVGKNDSYSGSRKKGGFMGRSKSTRSRGSFVDTESQRKVREDYD